MTGNQLIIGTRGSDLALKQTSMVKALLAAAHPELDVQHKVIATAGDKRPDLRFEEFSKGENAMLDKGIFIKELEIALEDLSIDAAVHSLKDVPSDLEKQFTIAAVLERAPIQDVLISREKFTIETLPAGSRVGTSSVRRARQLKWLRPDIEVLELRGNVPTRIRKVVEPGNLDAIMLAAAGLVRLGLLNEALDTVSIDQVKLHAQVLDQTKFYPAAGQGAIAIETRSKDGLVIDTIRSLNHAETEARVIAEREFLRLLGAGCQTPGGAHSWVTDGKLHMAVRVFSESDLSANPVEAEASMSLSSPLSLAQKLAGMVA